MEEFDRRMDGQQRLSNAFAALELDRLDALPQFSSSSGGSSVAENGHSATGTRRRNCNGSIHGAAAKNRKEDGVNETMPLAVYKLPLVWIDLEMTGEIV